MSIIDYIVLGAYFLVIAVIGFICMRGVKAQEDYFMGKRSFGKLIQTFAAFGAGTGAQEPIMVGRTTWTSGLTGIWSVFLWLFVTPFYWIVGVWYRRMRHITLGDWFAERYENKGLGAAYTVFGLCFYMFYLSTMFSAISKVAAPLVGVDEVPLPLFSEPLALEYVLVPLICLFVVLYGVLGGLRAAYWTDLLQGVFIILLSILLIPAGLNALVEKFGDPSTMGMMDGFRIMHDRVAPAYFEIFGGPRAGEFPVHYIISLVLLALVGIVVQPHFIATGGGSAKSENAARIGLVAGNFLKRFCTVGWALTGLIVLALMAESVEIAMDPDMAWGIAAREILGPMNIGLVGLMLACLLAALMSSADTYMLVTSALVVRNVYAAYIHPNASEKTYLLVGRITGLIIIFGAAVVALALMDVFAQFKLALELPILFAAPFWIGIFWRRANKWSAWLTVLFSALVFFIIPIVAPKVFPELKTNPNFTITNNIKVTTIERPATEVDVAKRAAWEQAYETASNLEDPELRQEALNSLGLPPPDRQVGEPLEETFRSGGTLVFWTGSLPPPAESDVEVISEEETDSGTVVIQRYTGPAAGNGRFNLDFLLYQALGIDLQSKSDAMLETLRLPTRLVIPFLVLILLSFVTPKDRKENLDRYYAKMKTPVLPDPEEDRKALEASYANPESLRPFKLFPNSPNLEIQKPRVSDVAGFLISFLICFLMVWLAVTLVNIGS